MVQTIKTFHANPKDSPKESFGPLERHPFPKGIPSGWGRNSIGAKLKTLNSKLLTSYGMAQISKLPAHFDMLYTGFHKFLACFFKPPAGIEWHGIHLCMQV